MRLKSALAWLEHGAAAVVLAALALGVAVSVLQIVAWQRLPDALKVLSGRQLAVDKADHRRLMAIEKEWRRRGSEEFDDLVTGRARKAFVEGYENRLMQFDRERAALRAISMLLEQREAAGTKKDAELLAREQQLAAKEQLARDAGRDSSFRKTLQLYQGMEPEMVAADFQRKWMDGADGRQEVIRLLRSLPSRVSAEVISAISDPDTRVAIMNEIRKS